jgi:hypothetical protein
MARFISVDALFDKISPAVWQQISDHTVVPTGDPLSKETDEIVLDHHRRLEAFFVWLDKHFRDTEDTAAKWPAGSSITIDVQLVQRTWFDTFKIIKDEAMKQFGVCSQVFGDVIEAKLPWLHKRVADDLKKDFADEELTMDKVLADDNYFMQPDRVDTLKTSPKWWANLVLTTPSHTRVDPDLVQEAIVDAVKLYRRRVTSLLTFQCEISWAQFVLMAGLDTFQTPEMRRIISRCAHRASLPRALRTMPHANRFLRTHCWNPITRAWFDDALAALSTLPGYTRIGADNKTVAAEMIGELSQDRPALTLENFLALARLQHQQLASGDQVHDVDTLAATLAIAAQISPAKLTIPPAFLSEPLKAAEPKAAAEDEHRRREALYARIDQIVRDFVVALFKDVPKKAIPKVAAVANHIDVY